MTGRRATPIHHSLMEIRTLGGVEHGLAVLNGTIAAVFVMGLKSPFWLPAAVIFHIALMVLTKRDPLFRQIYRRYMTQGHRYDPWPMSGGSRYPRPDGWGKGTLC